MNKLSTFVLLLLSTTAVAQITYPGDVTVTGSPVTVFDYSTDNCGGQTSVDGCPQFFRDADDNIQLINMHTTTFRMTGTNFFDLSVDCSAPIFESDSDPDPANFNYKEWLGGTWTDDGETIYGLVHSEWHGYDFDGECLSADIMKCWYNGITLVQSTDTGRTFTHATAPDHLVAAVPYEYDASYQSRQGAFGPSNIVQHPDDGMYYALFYTEENVNGTTSYQQTGGTCVMRTDDLSDPSSWRVWDGEDYATECVNPYTDTFEIEDHLLIPVMGGKQLTSLSYNTYFGQWMVVGPSRKYDINEDRAVQGFYYQLSDDLIHWTGPKLIMEMNFPDSDHNNDDLDEYGMYPTVIDHNATDRNFMYTGQECQLYYMVWNTYPIETSGSPNRDLVRVPITFSRNGVSEFTINGRGNQYDANPGDGVCATSSGLCSFYAAIQESNSRLPKYADTLLTVNFDVNGLNFNLQDAPFACQYPMFLDGWTQPGSQVNTLSIEEGNNAEIGIQFSFNGNPALTFEGGQSGLRGIIIKDHQGPAVTFTNKGGNTVEGCYLGTDSDGLTDQATATAGSGVRIENCDDNTVGGSDLASHNVIVGGVALINSDENTVQGNYVGVGSDGETSLENNGSIGLDINNSANNQVGAVSTETRNLWAGGYNRAISITGTDATGNTIQNNFMGINKGADDAIGSYNVGIYLADDASENQIGVPASANILGATSNGVAMILAEGGAHDNSIASNVIGTDWLGNYNLLEDDNSSLGGIYIGQDAFNNVIGTDGSKNNTITNCNLHGVLLNGSAGEGNSIIGNSIYGNGGMGIDLNFDNMINENDQGDEDSGPNAFQNFPEIETATVDGGEVTVVATLNSSADHEFRIEFFRNDECDPTGYGEAQNFIGSMDVTTDADGNVEFEFSGGVGITSDHFITCTATSSTGNTSEISACATVSSPEPDIAVDPEAIDMTSPQGESVWVTITISNEGTEPLTWSASNDQFWLQLSTYGSIVYPGMSTEVQALLLISALPVGEYMDIITLETNDPDEAIVEIPLVVNITEEPIIEFSPSSMDILQAANTTAIYEIEISNTGSGTLDWFSTAPIQDSWIYPTGTTSGDLENGETAIAQVAINTNGMAPGTYESEVVINSNASNESQSFIYIDLTVEEGETPYIETTVFEYDYCPGEEFEITYAGNSTPGMNNVYIAQLSDANGSFDNPIEIGDINSTSQSGEMLVVIPTGLDDGNGFRIRVNATNPVVTGYANESDITLHPWVEVSAPELNDACIQTPPFSLPEGTPEGGSWNGDGVVGNVFEPEVAGVGVHTLVYEIESPEGCTFKYAADIEVTETPQLELPVLGPYCENSMEVELVATPAGGSWIGDGISQGIFSPSEAGEGVHDLTYIYAAGGPCAATGIVEVEVFALPNVELPNQGDYCEGTELIPLFGASPEGGEFWGDGVVDEYFDPVETGIGTYMINYTYTDDTGCSGSATSTLTIYPMPEISFETPEQICENADPIQVVTNDQNCAFTGNGMIDDTFFPALAGLGQHTIECIAINEFGCQSEESATIEVVESPDVTLGTIENMCTNSDVVVLDMGTPQGGEYLINGQAMSFIDPFDLGSGVHSLSYNYGDNDCFGSAMTSFEIIEAPSTPYVTYDGIMLTSDAPSGNQWYLNGMAIEGATGMSLLPEESGDYSVLVTNGDCSSEMSNSINITITGMDEMEEDGFSVYPVPFVDKIIVVANERWPDDTQFRLYDDQGRLVHFSKAASIPFSNGKYIFKESIDELSRGQYYLLIMLNGEIKRAALQK